ncbi:MarR family winged helix-turn-helix transcriptional regulator [uncultured Jatrophihabitans sp.]|uniref:MarR family winged helix-turn-helix transcriptional regulator n=1 Tax=uncultured Jatrophihabitans sp. TaxID=1610747 RepID=UPI0035CAACF4
METGAGARLATLLFETFGAMVDEVLAELARSGHPGLTVANEFAMQAIDSGATNAAALSRSLGVTRQAATKTIAILEGLGYVVRDSDDSDARRKNVQLTDLGRRAITVGSDAFDRIRERWVDTVGPRQSAAAEKALTALRAELRSQRPRE